MQTRKFQRKIEDFVCEKCGANIHGNGYTDHCPVCLWGCHVDMNPGDRAAGCGGMMRPTNASKKGKDYIIEYICEKCGHDFRVKAARDDNFEMLLKINKIYNF
jgi:rubrerythrin